MKKKDRINQVPEKVRDYLNEILDYFDTYNPKKKDEGD